jgi:hypothetical protein
MERTTLVRCKRLSVGSFASVSACSRQVCLCPDSYHDSGNARRKSIDHVIDHAAVVRRQKETLENLCKVIPTTIWSRLEPDQGIAIEQVVGGNGGKGSFHFSCRKYLAEKSTD